MLLYTVLYNYSYNYSIILLYNTPNITFKKLEITFVLSENDYILTQHLS